MRAAIKPTLKNRVHRIHLIRHFFGGLPAGWVNSRIDLKSRKQRMGNRSVMFLRMVSLLFLLSLLGLPAVPAANLLGTVILLRTHEPNENAFSILIPKGWQTTGGIFRVGPTAQGGPSQSITAKLDFAVMNTAQGAVMMRWLPDVLYFDASRSPAGQMGLFPPGSNYAGMTVLPKMTADQFIQQVVLPYAHPQATGIRIVDGRNLPRLAQQYQQRMTAAIPGMTFSYDAALVMVTYEEVGVRYEEKLFCLIEDWGQLGAGMWGNKETFLMRAQIGNLRRYEILFKLMRDSMKINCRWLAGELQGQLQRIRTVQRVQRSIRQIEQDIVTHQQKTNAEINNDMFLTLTDQEEYVNPFSKEVEVGSNQWKHRWINPAGEVIYTNDDSYDPRVDVHLNRTDFEPSPIRKRFE